MTRYGMRVYAGMFQSTLPMKGATYSFDVDLYVGTVSIHAPNEGSDNIFIAETDN